MTNTTNVCNTEGLTHSFNRTVALNDVSISLNAGITGLVGPNGAGKTTLLRILATELAPDRGTVEVLGLDPSKADERLHIRRRLGYQPQTPGFHRHFRVTEYLDYIGLLKEITDTATRKNEVQRVIDAVDLKAEARSRIRTLSGGMRQRVALAQALIGHPLFLILDEPTVGLDPQQRLSFRDLLSGMSDTRAVLLSTHQIEDVAAICGQVIALFGGRVLFSGDPKNLADLAANHVWLAQARDPTALAVWRTGSGTYRHVGIAPHGAELIAPSVEDGYLMLLGKKAGRDAAREAVANNPESSSP